mmetsp:Transcript_64018/g.128499  ORF Transcript_64018/g.128499 Transcript_64018/m.128499 type:complete len:228 (+) Transcript_64018:71-754(+)
MRPVASIHLSADNSFSILCRIISVFTTVNELFQGCGCCVASFARMQINAVTVKQGVTGHVKDSHEVQGHEATQHHRDDHRSQGALQASAGLGIPEGSVGSRHVGHNSTGECDDDGTEDSEDKSCTVQDGHGAAQLDYHLHSLLGSVAEVVRRDGHVDVCVLVDEFDGVLAELDAAHATTQEALDDVAVGRLLVLVLRIFYDLLEGLQNRYEQRAESQRTCVVQQAHV